MSKNSQKSKKKMTNKAEKTSPEKNDEGAFGDGNNSPDLASESVDLGSPTIDEPNDPPTPSIDKVLKGVVAFVDVKVEDVNAKEAIEKKLKEMGAEVRKTFTKQITHCIFKNGKASNYKKAMSQSVACVNPLWVNECMKQNKKVDVSQYKAEMVQVEKKKDSKKRKNEEETTPNKKQKKEKSSKSQEKEKKEDKKSSKKKETKDEESKSKKDEKKEKKKDSKKGKKKEEKDEDNNSAKDKKKEGKDEKKTKKKEEKEKSDKKKSKKKGGEEEEKKNKKKLTTPNKKIKEAEEKKKSSTEKKKSPSKKRKIEEESQEESEDEFDAEMFEEMVPPKKKKKSAIYILEFTGLTREEREHIILSIEASKTLNPLFDFATNPDMEYNGEKFTHLIAGNDGRTIKTLFAIAYGANIVNKEWIFECINSNKCVDYKDYIRKQYAEACEKSRRANEKPKKKKDQQDNKIKPVLAGRKIAILGDTKPDKALLARLVQACGGTVVKTQRMCDFCIAGENAPGTRLVDVRVPIPDSSDKILNEPPKMHSIVTEEWLLDTIANYELPSDLEKYERTQEEINAKHKKRVDAERKRREKEKKEKAKREAEKKEKENKEKEKENKEEENKKEKKDDKEEKENENAEKEENENKDDEMDTDE